MLELVIAGSMIAGLMTGLSYVMRATRQTWDTLDTEYGVLNQMHGVSRHFVRAAREAKGVVEIASDGTGITLEMPNDRLVSWNWESSYEGSANAVVYSESDPATQSILAEQMRSVQFSGFRSDGLTVASSADEIQVINIRVTVDLPRSAETQRTIDSKVWIRSW